MTRGLFELENFLNRIGAFVLIRTNEIVFDTRGDFEPDGDPPYLKCNEGDCSEDAWFLGTYFGRYNKKGSYTEYARIASGLQAMTEEDINDIYDTIGSVLRGELEKVIPVNESPKVQMYDFWSFNEEQLKHINDKRNT